MTGGGERTGEDHVILLHASCDRQTYSTWCNRTGDRRGDGDQRQDGGDVQGAGDGEAGNSETLADPGSSHAASHRTLTDFSSMTAVTMPCILLWAWVVHLMNTRIITEHVLGPCHRVHTVATYLSPYPWYVVGVHSFQETVPVRATKRVDQGKDNYANAAA